VKFFRTLIKAIFAPFSLIKSEKNANNRLAFFAKHTEIVVIIALFVTAIVMLILYTII